MNHFDILNFVNGVKRTFLLERKNNYVHKIQNLSKKVIYELFKKLPGEGTGVDRIFNHMKDMLDSNKKLDWVECYINDIVNPYTNSKILIKIWFEYDKDYKWNISGEMYHSLEDSKNENIPYVDVIHIYIKFSEYFKFNNLGKKYFIEELYSTVVHELAHAYDENLIIDEISPTKREEHYLFEDANKMFLRLKYFLLYNTDPTEIRSRLNECFLMVKSTKRYSAKKDIKNTYKNTNGDKNKTNYSAPYHIRHEKNCNNPSHIFECLCSTIYKGDEIADEFGYDIKDFVARYFIAFARDYNDVMKRRYYDPLFKDIVKELTIPPLRQMDEFLDVLLHLCNRLRYMNEDSYNYPLVEYLFDKPIFDPIFKSCDPKKLQEAIDEIIKSFK